MREYYIESGEKIQIHADTVWTLWFIAKDSLEEKELNQFLDIFEILKKIKTNEEDTKLSKNLAIIIRSLTNRYQKYLAEISSTEFELEEKNILSDNKIIGWTHRIREIKKSYPRAYESWNETEERELEQLFKTGLTPSEISKKLKRQPGAIRSRLRRLGLLE
ncbi:MAG: hypothetical protein QXL17_06390 [Candidatus Thermoplasmatota archaeon]